MAADALNTGIAKRRITTLEILALVAFAAWALFELSVGVIGSEPQGAYYGWNTASDGVTVKYVTPNGPAARAGIEIGDKVDWGRLSLLGRSNIANVAATRSGTQLSVNLLRGNRTLTKTLIAQPFDRSAQDANRIGTIVLILVQSVGIGLVWLRPSRLTWAFLLGYGAPAFPLFATASVVEYATTFLAAAILTGVSVAATLVFISCFPRNHPRGVLVWLYRAALPLGICAASLALAVDTLIVLSPHPPPWWLLFPEQYVIGPALTVITLAALAVAASIARGSDRQRVLPVLYAIAFMAIAAQANQLYAISVTGGLAVEVLLAVQDLATLAFAVAVVNGVVRHRVIDISFTVSRTLVYTILTSLLVGLFALVDFVSSKFLEHLQITFFIEALAALAFGVALNSLHTRIDHFVDSFVFRRRHLAEQRLKRTGRTMMHSESESFIGEALIVEVIDALDLASAALFRRTDGEYARVLSEGWDDTQSVRLGQDDHLVVHLTAELQPVDLSDIRWPNVSVPQGYGHPLIAIPIIVRHELLGFVLYGGHRGGEAIDPDERRALFALAEAAGPAYEHIRMQALDRESERWQLEKTVLEHERVLLREMVDALRTARAAE